MKTCADLAADIGPITEQSYTNGNDTCCSCWKEHPNLHQPGVGFYAKKVELNIALYVVCARCYEKGVRYGYRNGSRGSYNVNAGRENAVGVDSVVVGEGGQEASSDTAEAGA